MLTGQNLGRVFNFKWFRVEPYLAIALIIKTAQLKVENLAQTTFRFSPVSFRAPRCKIFRITLSITTVSIITVSITIFSATN